MLDNATYISQMSREIPDNATSPFYWASEIRVVKKCIKNTFPNWIVANGVTDLTKLKVNFLNIQANSSSIFLTNNNYKQTTPLDEDKKDLSIHHYSPTSENDAQTAFVRPISPLPPIGSLVESSLTDAQMQLLYPNGNFVLCDGRDCTGTYYWHVKGRPATLNVPDLRNGNFLRPTSLESKIGTFGAQGTRSDFLTATVSDDSHSMTIGHNSNLNHNHTYVNGGVPTNSNMDNAGGASSANPNNTVTLQTSTNNMIAVWNHNSNEHNFVFSGGALKTLPNHLNINVFIRVK